jgi:hypothetical protein
VGKTVWLCLLALALALVLNGWHMISAYLRATKPPESEQVSEIESEITNSAQEQDSFDIVPNQDSTVTYQEYKGNDENGVYYYYEKK